MDTENMQSHSLGKGSYGYSAANLDSLGASEYTLVTIIQDASGSVGMFAPDMEKAIKEVVKACYHSPRADNLMVRLVQFSDSFSKGLDEIHGFKMLSGCTDKDYDNCLNCGGLTPLYDAAVNAIEATGDYAKKLSQAEFNSNAIVIIVTDGLDNASAESANSVKKALNKLVTGEYLESVVTVLIGVNVSDQFVSQSLENFRKEAELTQYVELEKADSKSLAKLAKFISKSISQQSSSLGTGAPSQQISISLNI